MPVSRLSPRSKNSTRTKFLPGDVLGALTAAATNNAGRSTGSGTTFTRGPFPAPPKLPVKKNFSTPLSARGSAPNPPNKTGLTSAGVTASSSAFRPGHGSPVFESRAKSGSPEVLLHRRNGDAGGVPGSARGNNPEHSYNYRQQSPGALSGLGGTAPSSVLGKKRYSPPPRAPLGKVSSITNSATGTGSGNATAGTGTGIGGTGSIGLPTSARQRSPRPSGSVGRGSMSNALESSLASSFSRARRAMQLEEVSDNSASVQEKETKTNGKVDQKNVKHVETGTKGSVSVADIHRGVVAGKSDQKQRAASSVKPPVPTVSTAKSVPSLVSSSTSNINTSNAKEADSRSSAATSFQSPLHDRDNRDRKRRMENTGHLNVSFDGPQVKAYVGGVRTGNSNSSSSSSVAALGAKSVATSTAVERKPVVGSTTNNDQTSSSSSSSSAGGKLAHNQNGTNVTASNDWLSRRNTTALPLRSSPRPLLSGKLSHSYSGGKGVSGHAGAANVTPSRSLLINNSFTGVEEDNYSIQGGAPPTPPPTGPPAGPLNSSFTTISTNTKPPIVPVPGLTRSPKKVLITTSAQKTRKESFDKRSIVPAVPDEHEDVVDVYNASIVEASASQDEHVDTCVENSCSSASESGVSGATAAVQAAVQMPPDFLSIAAGNSSIITNAEPSPIQAVSSPIQVQQQGTHRHPFIVELSPAPMRIRSHGGPHLAPSSIINIPPTEPQQPPREKHLSFIIPAPPLEIPPAPSPIIAELTREVEKAKEETSILSEQLAEQLRLSEQEMGRMSAKFSHLESEIDYWKKLGTEKKRANDSLKLRMESLEGELVGAKEVAEKSVLARGKAEEQLALTTTQQKQLRKQALSELEDKLKIKETELELALARTAVVEQDFSLEKERREQLQSVNLELKQRADAVEQRLEDALIVSAEATEGRAKAEAELGIAEAELSASTQRDSQRVRDFSSVGASIEIAPSPGKYHQHGDASTKNNSNSNANATEQTEQLTKCSLFLNTTCKQHVREMRSLVKTGHRILRSGVRSANDAAGSILPPVSARSVSTFPDLPLPLSNSVAATPLTQIGTPRSESGGDEEIRGILSRIDLQVMNFQSEVKGMAVIGLPDPGLGEMGEGRGIEGSP